MCALKTQSNPPPWLEAVQAAGYRPYIATSTRLLPHLNLRPFGTEPAVFTAEDPAAIPFHEAYLLSNSLSFKSPDLKMPHWVMIDCVLMQTAVVGFTRAKAAMPDELLKFYRDDPAIDLGKLTDIPVSGQIASMTADRESMFGFSLFSLGRRVNGYEKLGLYTRAMAMEVYKLSGGGRYYGIAQYDNPALRIHGRLSSVMEIYQPTVALHPKRDMTLIYTMRIDYDPYTLDTSLPDEKPDFWLKANDTSAKADLQAKIAAGKRYRIAPPYQVEREGSLYLPIIEL